MNPRILDLWTTALRSGEFRQGRGKLVTISPSGVARHCCLGVLCELAVREGVVERIVREDALGDKHVAFAVPGHVHDINYLPYAVQQWAGLSSRNPRVGTELDAYGGRPTLASSNDTGKTFAQIADIIETELT